MRILEYICREIDDGHKIKSVVRSRLGISHRQLSHLKLTDGMCAGDTPVHANFIVHTGDRITVRLEEDLPAEGEDIVSYALTEDDWTREELDALSPCGNAATPEVLARQIIVYEDEDITIVNKPAPLPTGGSPHNTGLTLEGLMLSLHAQPYQFRPVNRLDKGTSGLMLLANTAHAHWAMQKQLHTDSFVREYLAVTDGCPKPPQGRIDLPIGRVADSAVKRCVSADGRECVTRYRVLAETNTNALLALRLETGRTHQIRVHLSALSCPVTGDFLYGREREDVLTGRFALHSAYLKCVHPVSGETLAFASPLPKALARFVPEAVQPDWETLEL